MSDTAARALVKVGLVIEGISPMESAHFPESWRTWVKNRSYDTLAAAPTTVIRSKADQLAADSGFTARQPPAAPSRAS